MLPNYISRCIKIMEVFSRVHRGGSPVRGVGCPRFPFFPFRMENLFRRRYMQEEENTKTIPEMVEEVQAGKMPRRNFIKTLTAMGISAAGVGVIAADAANPRASKLTPATRLDENVAKNLHLHDQHLQDRSQGNAGALQ